MLCFIVWTGAALDHNAGMIRAESLHEADAIASAMYGNTAGVVEWRYSSDADRLDAIECSSGADAHEAEAVT